MKVCIHSYRVTKLVESGTLNLYHGPVKKKDWYMEQMNAECKLSRYSDRCEEGAYEGTRSNRFIRG